MERRRRIAPATRPGSSTWLTCTRGAATSSGRPACHDAAARVAWELARGAPSSRRPGGGRRSTRSAAGRASARELLDKIALRARAAAAAPEALALGRPA
ncbi:MAG: hypothetical protein KIT58_01315 [Planctomycetota bacterium]|nr:hypothetical protein [Planctomycetota bacterium]